MYLPEIQLIPKVDLHVHLEGSITPQTLLQLAELQNLPLPPGILTSGQNRYAYSGPQGFFDIYPTVCQFVKSPEALEFATKAFLRNQAAQNIVYSEVIFTPFIGESNFTLDDQLRAIERGRQWGLQELGVKMALVMDVSRDRPIEQCWEVVKWMVEVQECGASNDPKLLGFGIGGVEKRGLPQKFAPLIHPLKKAGLRILPHAGEQMGPPILWDTIHYLQPDRIGHGVRCVEDPRLIEWLYIHQIPLDVSPLSNIALGFYPSLGEHPLTSMIQFGLNISLNSDDPGLMNFTLNQQIMNISKSLKFDDEIIYWLIQNGVNNSFMSPKEKGILTDKINEIFSKKF